MTIRPGEAFVSLAVLLWLSVSVGPWWIGALIFGVGMALNLIHANGPTP